MSINLGKLNDLITFWSLERSIENHNSISFSCILSKSRLWSFKESCDRINIDYRVVVDDDFQPSFFQKTSTKEHVIQISDSIIDDEIKVTIEIKKRDMIHTQFHCHFHVIICSSLSWLNEQLSGKTLTDIENYLFSDDQKTTIIGVLNDDIEATNNFIAFAHINRLQEFSTPWTDYYSISTEFLETGKKLIKKRNENVHWNERITHVGPEYFYIENIETPDLKKLFDQWFASCVIGSLAKFTFYNADNHSYESNFSGFKNIKIAHSFNDQCLAPQHLSNLKQLYEWVYTEKENISDKINLVQNIVSIHLKNNCSITQFINKSQEIRESSIENYNVYIENSIEEFFTQRMEYENLIRFTTTEIEKQVNNISSLMIKNFYGVIAASITAVITMARRSDLEFLAYIRYVYSTFILLLTIYYSLFSFMNIRSKTKFFKSKQDEFDKFFRPGRTKELEGNVVNDQCTIYYVFLISTWIINIILIIFSVFAAIYIQTEFNIINWIFQNFIVFKLLF